MEPAEYRLMDQAEAGMWWYRALHARIADALRATRGRVLDAGCGTGGLLARLSANPALDLHGLEYEADAARRAAEKSGARIVRGSINTLPFADASFAAVVSALLRFLHTCEAALEVQLCCVVQHNTAPDGSPRSTALAVDLRSLSAYPEAPAPDRRGPLLPARMARSAVTALISMPWSAYSRDVIAAQLSPSERRERMRSARCPRASRSAMR